MRRVAVFTDAHVATLPWFAQALETLRRTPGVDDVAVFAQCKVEPSAASLEEAAAFVRDAGRVDGVVSIGGGSVMDTAKVANLLYVHGGSLHKRTNAPIGEGAQPDGPLLPHIAVPTTSGTGSEQTTLSIYDLPELNAKTGIGNRFMRPSLALIDAVVMDTLPASVVAASAFDVLSHATESYLARPYTQRDLPLNFVRVRGAARAARARALCGGAAWLTDARSRPHKAPIRTRTLAAARRST